MSHQPLYYVCREGHLLFHPRALRDRPEHAALIAQVISTWAHVEANLGRICAQMLRTSASTAAAMYSSINSFQAQRSLLDSIAQEVLSPEGLELHQAVMVAVIPCSQDRHDFAHGIWGIVEEYLKDAVIWAEPKTLWKHTGATLEYLNNPDWMDVPGFLTSGPEIDRRKIRVYTIADLREIHHRIIRAYNYTKSLEAINACAATGRSSARADRIYNSLYNEPDILRCLDKLRGKFRKRPEALPQLPPTSDVY